MVLKEVNFNFCIKIEKIDVCKQFTHNVLF